MLGSAAAALMAIPSLSHAEGPPATIPVAPLTAPAFEALFAPRVDEAIVRTGFLTSADLGTWAVRPTAFLGEERPIRVAGGEVGLTDSLSLSLYGATDVTATQFSAMNAAFRLRLLPEMSAFQLTAFSGFAQDAEGGGGPTAGLATGVSWGKLRAAWTVRGFTPLTGPASQPRVSSDAAITYDLSRVTFGVQQTRQLFAGSRSLSAAAASVSLKPAEGWRLTATSSSIFGGKATPLRVSIFGVW
jgi:hypothetical protein